MLRFGRGVLLAALLFAGPAFAQPHNLVLFVADALRSQIVDETTAPDLQAVRRDGVDFRNSHSLFPTVTTANASVIATG
ncbi:MAG TPA: alkaline phosphatase family protein, partial [Phenylobacterium sp.]|nr:alkaline phosphatase family protein [Phenylobacterium sp.]